MIRRLAICKHELQTNGKETTSLVPLLLVPLGLLFSQEVLGHRLLLLLEQWPVRLLRSHRLHNQCWRRMLNRSCCHMMSHS